MTLIEQRSYYEGQAQEQTKIINELEEQCKKLQAEENNINKREFRKYVEGIN